jgi:ligand-binding sensor domain-containing protein/signal transduction histidine kinase
MKKLLLLAIIFFAFYLPANLSHADIDNQQANSYHFSGFNKQDGLSNNQISDIFQDSHGFLWVTTSGGLNRFDGIHFINFNAIETADKNSIPSWINVIIEDKSENLWLGTYAGVAKVAMSDYQVTLYPIEQDRSIYVNDLLIDDQKVIWAGTTEGLYRFSDEQQKFEKIDIVQVDSAEINNIWQLTTDAQGNIWFVDEILGSVKFDKETLAVTKISDVYPELTLLTKVSVMQFIDGDIWLGSSEGKVAVLNMSTNSVQEIDLPLDGHKHIAGATIMSFVDDKYGNVWVATMGKGVYQISSQGHEIKHFYRDANLDFSLKDNAIWTMYRDQENRIWFGGNIEGIMFYDPKSHLVNHYFPDDSNPNSIRNNVIWSIYQDSQQKLWVGGDNGIDVLNSKRQKEFSLRNDPNDDNSLVDNRVFSMIEDSEGYMWLSTHHGLNRYDQKSKQNKHYLHHEGDLKSLPSNIISNLFIDSTNTLWVGTARGSVQYSPSTDNFLAIDSLANYEIYSMVETSPNKYWLATAEQGLLFYDQDENIINKYIHDPDDGASLASNKVTRIIQDNKYLWVATQNGLNRINIDSQTFKRFSSKDGLPSNVIYQVRRDKQGFIWGSTDNGIFRLNPLTDHIITLGVNNGLQALDFTSTASFISQNNEIFFGGVNGFNSIIASDKFLPIQASAPLTTELRVLNEVITPLDSLLLNQAIHLTDKLILNHNQKWFSLAFNSIELSRASNLAYQYKLLGFNEQWLTPLPGRPQASFTNLNSGRYQFLTRARIGNEPWIESGRALEIVINPPYWATWWAYSLYLLISLVIFISIYWQYYQRNVQRVTYLANLENQKRQLDLALWGSGEELWDWNLSTKQLTRMNCLDNTLERREFVKFSVENLIDFIHPEDLSRVQGALMGHINGELDFFEQSYRIRTSSNGWMWVLHRGKVVERGENNEPNRCAGTIQNIDKLKAVEEALIQLTDQLEERVNIRTEELQRSNVSLTNTLNTLKLTQQQLIESEKMAALGNLIVGVSHELNTPLGTSITALSVLQDKVTQLFEMKTNNKLSMSFFNDFEVVSQECLKSLTISLHRTDDLVQNFQQVAVDQSDEDKKNINIKLLLQECAGTETSKFSPHDFSLNINCENEIIIDCYPMVLSQVIAQLIDNSFEHNTQKNRLNIGITVNDLNNSIEVVYTDDGNGITKETYDRMFEPFYTTKRGEGNTGLGMHIVYNQVTQKLGGKIEYIAHANMGAQFNITLPKISLDRNI